MGLCSFPIPNPTRGSNQTDLANGCAFHYFAMKSYLDSDQCLRLWSMGHLEWVSLSSSRWSKEILARDKRTWTECWKKRISHSFPFLSGEEEKSGKIRDFLIFLRLKICSNWTVGRSSFSSDSFRVFLSRVYSASVSTTRMTTFDIFNGIIYYTVISAY